MFRYSSFKCILNFENEAIVRGKKKQRLGNWKW
jgi:hypothetical protein